MKRNRLHLVEQASAKLTLLRFLNILYFNFAFVLIE